MNTFINRYFVGLDLGQARDFTALAVVERTERDGGRDPVSWEQRKIMSLQVRHLERVPLGTTYPLVVRRVCALLRILPAGAECELLVDATGVGRPVVDLLKQEDLPGPLLPVLVTSGHSMSVADGFFRIPKRDLITGLQVAIQTEELRIANGLDFGPTLLKEMTEMKVKVSDGGTEQFGAWREGTHDDLVFAVALATWGAKRWEPPADMCGRQRLF